MPKARDKQTPDFGHPRVASRDRLNAFLEGMAKLQKEIKNEEDIERQEAIRTYLQRYVRDELQGLMGRAFADALKSPSQKLGTAKPPLDGAPRAKKTKPAANSKKRLISKKARSRKRRRGASR